jgi:hypothetical protein
MEPQPVNFINTGYIYQKIYDLFSGGSPKGIFTTIVALLSAFLDSIRMIAFIVSTLLLFGISYSLIQIDKIRKKERELLYEKPADDVPENVAEMAFKPFVNEKWVQITEHISTNNPNDWRQAIIEADIMLEEMMVAMGYMQATLGEKLKAVERSDFTTIDQAWEAHKVRNLIAHEGSDYLLTEREARRVIGLYEQAFKEFKAI